jgi:hypothetical protein
MGSVMMLVSSFLLKRNESGRVRRYQFINASKKKKRKQFFISMMALLQVCTDQANKVFGQFCGGH